MTFDGRAQGRPPTRRQLLAAVGTGLASGIAGCGGDGQGNGTPAPNGDGNADGGSNGNGQDGGTPTATEPGTSTPEKTTVPPESIDRPALELAIGERVNELRQANGVGFIDWDDELRQIARDHSTAMIQQDFFGHVNPMGNNWSDRYQDADYRCAVRTNGGIRNGGECIARVSYEELPSKERIAVEVVDILRADTEGGAMLASYWNVHGIGIAWQTAGSETRIYVTQNFC